VVDTRQVAEYTVLVVEDDHGLRDVLARGLRDAEFEVTVAVDGRSALHAVESNPVDGIVMDIGLPDSDGRDVCIALRARGVDVPILFLTARGNVTDRLAGFASGGDDYLSKPFAFPELIARLTALLRRSVTTAQSWGDLSVDPATHAVMCRDHRAALSPIEFRLLARLLAAPDVIVRRRELIAAGWPYGAIVADNTLDQYVSRLRRKLSDVGSQHAIRSARGVGYGIA
jgi:DNA-binding response OmpR family regulator